MKEARVDETTRMDVLFAEYISKWRVEKSSFLFDFQLNVHTKERVER